jgi:hypothetical protein
MATPAMGTCKLAQALLMAAFWLLAPRVLANLR